MGEPFEIAIFPLPDVVFFPETVLPLHVFEPRYRQMVADCVAGDGRLAVVRLREGWERDYYGRPPVHDVAGAGQIIQTERLADGRYNILLDGRTRVRIEAEVRPEAPYRIGRVTALDDVVRAEDIPSLRERLRTLRASYGKLLEALGQGHAELVGRLTVAGARPGAVIDRIVSAVVPDASLRQRILEATDVSQRLDLATAALLDLLTLVSGTESDGEAEGAGE